MTINSTLLFYWVFIALSPLKAAVAHLSKLQRLATHGLRAFKLAHTINQGELLWNVVRFYRKPR